MNKGEVGIRNNGTSSGTGRKTTSATYESTVPIEPYERGYCGNLKQICCQCQAEEQSLLLYRYFKKQKKDVNKKKMRQKQSTATHTTSRGRLL